MKIYPPHFVGEYEGEVASLEFFNGKKKVTVFFDSTYLKVWGPNMHHEMEDGELTTEKMVELFDWLYDQGEKKDE